MRQQNKTEGKHDCFMSVDYIKKKWETSQNENKKMLLIIF